MMTQKSKPFIRCFYFFDCANQTNVPQLETRYFDAVKSMLKQMQCVEYDSIKMPKATSDGFWVPVSHIVDICSRVTGKLLNFLID